MTWLGPVGCFEHSSGLIYTVGYDYGLVKSDTLLYKCSGMITSIQMRAGRLFAGWDQKDLSHKAGVALSTVQRMEASDGLVRGRMSTVDAVIKAFGRAGVEFIAPNGGGPGVRLRHA